MTEKKRYIAVEFINSTQKRIPSAISGGILVCGRTVMKLPVLLHLMTG